MPLARLAGISGYLNDDQKKRLIQEVTDAILSVEGEGLRPVTWVLLEDVPEGHWGVGGEVATVELLRSMRDGNAP